jgi:hypothetical protein
MQNRLASAGLWGLRERSVQVSGRQQQQGSLHNANFCIKHKVCSPRYFMIVNTLGQIAPKTVHDHGFALAQR